MAYKSPGRDRRMLALALIVGLILLVALWAFFGGGRGAGAGGGAPTNTTTTTSPPPQNPTVYPTSDIPNGYDLILVEDHVTVSDGQYYLTATAYGTFQSVIGYGGSKVSGNISSGMPYIIYGGVSIPIIAVASTSSNVTVDYPGMQIRLDKNGGYILYTQPNLALYYRYMAFNVSGVTVHVWAPAKSLPTTLTNAEHHAYIDPVNGIAYIDGSPSGLVPGVVQTARKGVLRAWLVYTDKGGTYAFNIYP